MDLNNLTLFKLMKGQMGWLGRRQEVLAQNVANADTPGYKARDLQPFDFQDMVRREQRMQMAGVQASSIDAPQPGGRSNSNTASAIATTHPNHFAGNRAQTSPFAEVQDAMPFETAPNGNAVVLEEQMAKLGETQVQHRLTTELYRKHIGMIKIAIGKGR